MSDQKKPQVSKSASLPPGAGGPLSSATTGAGEFRATRSAAEMAMLEADYADPGLAEHKGGKHLDEHWKKGREGMDEEDYSEERARLQEMQQKGYGPRALIARAAAAVGGLVSAAASKVAPSYFKTSSSAAQLAYGNTVDYAEPGLAEHKGGGKHLEEHWKKGREGLRPEDAEEDRARMKEMGEREASKGIVQRAKEAVSGAVSAATTAATAKASGALQAAISLGVGSEKGSGSEMSAEKK